MGRVLRTGPLSPSFSSNSIAVASSLECKRERGKKKGTVRQGCKMYMAGWGGAHNRVVSFSSSVFSPCTLGGGGFFFLFSCYCTHPTSAPCIFPLLHTASRTHLFPSHKLTNIIVEPPPPLSLPGLIAFFLFSGGGVLLGMTPNLR